MVNEVSGVRACCIPMLSEAMSLDDFGQAVVLPPCQQQQCNVTSTSCLPITRTPATSSLVITPITATAPLSTSTSLLSPSESSNLSITRTAAAALLSFTPATSTAALSTSPVSPSELSNTSRWECYPCAINPIVSGAPSEQHNVQTKHEQSLIQPSIPGQVLNQASIHTIPPRKQSREHKPFWRGFEDTPSLPNDTEATVQSPDDTLKTEDTANILKTEDTAELVCDLEANMALLSNKKLCKLDAICAKLINKGPTNDVGTIGQTAADHDNDNDLPEDLSSKCLNNNIIGKVDLHNVGKAQDNAAVITNSSHSIKHSSSDELTVTSEDTHKDTNNVFDATHDNILSNKSPKLFPHEQFGYNNAIGSSRRKSRKASTPRNIAQVRDIIENVDEKDELAEYEINNLNTNFPPEENDVQDIEKDNKDREARTSTASSYNIPNNGDIEDYVSDHSLTLNHSKLSSLNHSTSSKKSNISSDLSDVFDEAAPLDLSVSNKSIRPDNDESVHDNDDGVSDDEEYLEDDRHLIIDEQTDKISVSRSSSPVNVRRDSGGEQAAHLKDYAESTMNELISMYGFGGQNPTDLSRHASLANFRHMIPASLRPIPADVPILPTKKPKLSIDSESDDGSQHEKAFGMALHNPAGNQIKPEVGIKLQNDRFTTSSSFINAVFNANSGAATDPLLAPKTLLPNYSKYLKRYNNGNECGNQHCKDLLYKEHYHCIDCSFQVFIKKEEMVRHYKWHKKREESLQHGFLRFSPLDNCSKRFGPCTHNRKQTHYHCLQKGCDKVYISTSDVQMHANYHRKDSAIMSEGFQRFRATEDCGTLACAFYGQRTTHFHCLRPDCKFTFKNKADMEKHKSYHQKDEVLGRDGFKKFMKYEHCNFPGCRYSKLSNHIHCIRSGCDYVLHSTAQLYSHKRKHERRDFEAAYKHFRTNQPPLVVPQPNKGIIPRNDFGTASQAQSIALKPVVQAVPTSVIQTMAGMKRPASNSQHELLELKKPKLEPMMESNSDVDISAPPSPGTSTGRSSPGDHMMDRNNSNYSMDDNMSDFSDSGHHDDDKQHGNSSFDEDSLDLSSSLSLKIPLLSNKDEPGTSPDSKSPSMQPSASNTSLPVTFSSINSTMPGTLPGSLLPMMNQGTMMTVPSTLTGVSTALQPPKSVYNERREKDDSWKNYLVRYTANDPCNPRCQYLYKDHYHCKIDGCLVLFKSKDGVREHARFHELQDRITPIAYKEYSDTEACPDACQYSEKERHYHCIWTDCTHVVPYIGPTFGRLEHYRIHEYARAAAGKAYGRSNRNVGNIDDSHMRRRGRPPKYPKIELPKIPKVELSDEEIRQSQAPLKDSEATLPADTKVFNGFRIFHRDDPCPDDQCSFIGRLHYHCARPRCFTITDRLDVLNLHAKDFHSFVNILEGYEFFDRNVSCRRMNCINNQTNRHFHCTRPKCDYSFIRHSTMAQHEKKHNGAESGPTFCTPDNKKDKAAVRRDVPIPILPATKPTNSQPIPVNTVQPLTTVIKTEPGTLIPVPSLNQNLMPNLPLLISPTQGGPLIIPQAAGIPSVTLPGSSTGVVTAVPLAIPISTIQALPPSVTSSHLVSGIPNTNIPHTQTDGQTSAVNTNTTAPLTVLLQRGINQIPQPSWNEIKVKMHYGLSQNCGRPFCKLKKKDHYHCYDCNQAFSDPARLRSHIGKHGIKFKRSDSSTQPLALVPGSSGLKTPNINTGDEIENGDMDPNEAKCLADNGNMSDSENEEDKNSSSLNLNPSTFSEMISKAQEQNKLTDFPEMSFPSMDSSKAVDYSKPVKLTDIDNNSCDSELNLTMPNFSVQNIMKTKQEGFMNSNNISLSNPGLVGGLVGGLKNNYVLKQPFKIDQPNHLKIEPPNHLKIEPPNHLKIDPPNHKSVVPGAMRAMKDESVPPGYSRWKYNQECSYPKCAYRHSVTHFHCNRSDCGYGFSDRSRLVQHSLRHERIDSITGGELQQYRINQDCEKPNCEFNRKMSHFHCKRCEYSCTDSSKVLTHRKHHAKLDSIANQGFKKFGATEGCGVRLCAYEKRQTHFHCLVESCKAAVLGLPQMNSHKLKHVGSLH